MSKLIVVLLLVAPLGAFADTIGCVAGGLGLGAVGSQIGGPKTAAVLTVVGAIIGCGAGSRIEDGTYGVQQAPTVTRTVTLVSSVPVSTNSSPCPSHWEGSYFMEEGYRRAQTGGITRDGCGSRVQNVSPAVYRVEETRTSPSPPKKYFGPTVHDYTESQYIDSRCKTGNPGADGNCLLVKVQALRLKQLACEGKTQKTSCPSNYNPGLWAHVYDRLGKELVARQVEMQGGEKFEPQ